MQPTKLSQTTGIKAYEDIKKVITEHRIIEARTQALKALGYEVRTCPMGSGGVGQIRYLEKEIRVQYGAGFTRYNKAWAVILPKTNEVIS